MDESSIRGFQPTARGAARGTRQNIYISRLLLLTKLKSWKVKLVLAVCYIKAAIFGSRYPLQNEDTLEKFSPRKYL